MNAARSLALAMLVSISAQAVLTASLKVLTALGIAVDFSLLRVTYQSYGAS